MTKLNTHQEPLVAEYSIWGLHCNSDFGIDDLGFPLHTVATKPENVRRWTDRLLTKDPVELATKLDVLSERSRDASPKAREGLAIGIRSLWIAGIDDVVLPWFGREASPLISDLLVEHMAINSDHTVDYKDIVSAKYRQGQTPPLTRDRILAASIGTSLYLDIRELEVEQKHHLPLLQGVHNVTQNFNTGGGPLNIGANMGSGTMTIEAHALVQQMGSATPEQQKALSKVVALAERLPAPVGEPLAVQVAAYAKSPRLPSLRSWLPL